MWILWIIASTLFYAYGEYFSKKYSNTHEFQYVIYAMIMYGCGTPLWLMAIKAKNHLVITSTTWTILALFFTYTIGFIIFKERISLINSIGLGFGIVGIILLNS